MFMTCTLSVESSFYLNDFPSCFTERSGIFDPNLCVCDRAFFSLCYLNVIYIECRMLFGLIRSLIGQKNLHHFLNQSEVKREPIVTCSNEFSRALRLSHGMTSNSDWFAVLLLSVVSGQSDNFGFGLTYYAHLRNASKQRYDTKLLFVYISDSLDHGSPSSTVSITGSY